MKLTLFFTLLFYSLSTFAVGKITLYVKLDPAGSFQAVSESLSGEIIKEKEVFSAKKILIDIESFKTGISLRDGHFWKHLQSSKYPEAIMTHLRAKEGKGMANLEINGIKKEIEMTYVEKDKNVTAKFEVKASDFSLPKAEYLGVKVEDIVAIEVTMPFRSK